MFTFDHFNLKYRDIVFFVMMMKQHDEEIGWCAFYNGYDVKNQNAMRTYNGNALIAV